MQKIAVFCGSSMGFSAVYEEAAKNLGLLFAKNNIALVYGGAKVGLMGIVADTILNNGGKVYGILPHILKKEEVAHSGVTEMFFTETMSERKLLMSKMADGYIALAGGFGTLDELFEVLTLNQIGKESKPIGILNTNNFYDYTLKQLSVMAKEGFLKEKNKDLLITDTTADGLLQKMKQYVKPLKTTSKIVTKK